MIIELKDVPSNIKRLTIDRITVEFEGGNVQTISSNTPGKSKPNVPKPSVPDTSIRTEVTEVTEVTGIGEIREVISRPEVRSSEPMDIPSEMLDMDF